MDKHVICDLYGNYCFKIKMEEASNNDTNNCLPTCHQIQYTYSEVIEKRDAESICDG